MAIATRYSLLSWKESRAGDARYGDKMDNKRYLIREFYALCENGFCEDVLNESEKAMRASGTMILSGKLSEADRLNGNGRIYSRGILEREIEKYATLIQDRRSLGSLDHPESEIVELGNASHLVTRVWWEGNTLNGVCQVLSTPQGKVLEALIKDGVKIGISSRGVGSVNETSSGIEVQDDFALIAFDMVAEPSSQNAFMGLTESKLSAMDVDRIRQPRAERVSMLMDEILRG